MVLKFSCYALINYCFFCKSLNIYCTFTIVNNLITNREKKITINTYTELQRLYKTKFLIEKRRYAFYSEITQF